MNIKFIDENSIMTSKSRQLFPVAFNHGGYLQNKFS